MKTLTDQFIDWVNTKPRDEAYDWENRHGCAFCLFLVESGLPVRSVDPSRWTDDSGAEHPLDDGIAQAVRQTPWTFGTLADRLSEHRAAVDQSRMRVA